MDDPFSGNGNSSSGDERAFGGLFSVLAAHNFQPLSSGNHWHYVGGYLGMLGGQTLSEAPFVGFLSDVDEATRSPNSSNFLQASFGTGFPNHESSSSSLGEHATHGDLTIVPAAQPLQHPDSRYSLS